MSSGVCLRFVGIFVFVRRFLVVVAAAQHTQERGRKSLKTIARSN